MGMTAISTWTCDQCSKTIGNPSEGIMIWNWTQGGEPRVDKFRIIHNAASGQPCDSDTSASSIDLTHLVGIDGLAQLLSFLSIGPIRGGGGVKIEDFDNYVDTVRRLQTPGYEEVRSKFGSQEVADEFGDASEYAPYLTESLEKISRL